MSEKGYSIAQLLNSTAGKEYIKSKKNIVVCLGTNDATMFTAEKMMDNMSSLVATIKQLNSAAQITVVTPPIN
jgi:lysophospholipase L1-like esterase